MLKLTKKGDKYWLFEDSEIGLFSPSKFTINLELNEIVIVYENGLKSKRYNVIDCEIYDLGELTPFTTSSGDLFMQKLEELNCPCFQKNENIYNIFGGGSWGSITGTLSDQTDLQTALDGKLSNDISEYTSASLPLSDTDKLLVNQGGTFKEVAKSELGGGVVPNAIGDIYNKNTWANTSDFTTFGDATVSLSGSYINIGSATNGSFNNYIKFSRVTNLNKYRMVIEFKVINAPSATTFGVGLGLRSANSISGNVYQYVARVGLPSTANGKRIYIDAGSTTYTNRFASATDFSFAQNDIIRLTVEQDLNIVTCTFLNLTTGNAQVGSYNFPISSAPILPNTGNFVIHTLGGTYEIRKLAVESKDYENAKLICVGDSKTVGYFADSFAGAFSNQLVSYSRGVSVNAGGNDKTAEVLLKIPELITLKPKRVLLNIGSNDKRNGVTFATWQANYDSIVSQLETAGIEVWHLLQLNETSLTFTDYNLHITSTYDSSKIIDAGVISLNADGIHPNQQAMNHIFYTILSKIKLD